MLEESAARLPMFVSEFGTVEYSGNGAFDEARISTPDEFPTR